MKQPTAMGRLAVIAAMSIVALPLPAWTSSGSSERSGQPKTTSVAKESKKLPSQVSLSSKKPISNEPEKLTAPKPNFYADAASKSKKTSANSGVSKRKQESKGPEKKTASTVAGPTSVRRLQPPSGELIQTVSYAPVAQKSLSSRSDLQVPGARAQIPDVSPQTTVASTAEKRSLWSRLNPLSLFEGHKPKLVSTGYIQTGIASWYGAGFHGGPTASGERYDMNDLTAAHPSLPFGTLLRVTNLRNGREVIVRVNNRGPYVRNRILDLSKEAARQLGMVGSGLAKVRVEVLEAVEPIGRWGQQKLQQLSGRP